MASPSKAYHRLPGTGYRRLIPSWAMVLLFFVLGIFVLLFRGRRLQLWLGQDHLLLVEWDGYQEAYKRFPFRDIQAVVLQKTNEGLATSVALSAVLGLLVVLLLTASQPAMRVTLGILAAVLGLALGINAASGPTCRCLLRTAVQTEELPSLGRLSRARKVLDRLRPLIAEAQGQLSASDLQTIGPEPAANPPASVAPAGDAAGSAPTGIGS